MQFGMSKNSTTLMRPEERAKVVALESQIKRWWWEPIRLLQGLRSLLRCEGDPGDCVQNKK